MSGATHLSYFFLIMIISCSCVPFHLLSGDTGRTRRGVVFLSMRYSLRAVRRRSPALATCVDAAMRLRPQRGKEKLM